MGLEVGNANYLIKPSGEYGVAYQELPIVNNTICPDKIYKNGVNESDFSNNKHCHEIILGVYYPTLDKYTTGSNYYLPYLIEANKYYIKNYKLNKPEANQLSSILSLQTYVLQQANPVLNKRFPVLLFMPGSGQSTFTYINIISNLVSFGYIVIGINSVFASGPLKISNGNTISWLESYNDNTRLENLADLNFVIQNMKNIFSHSRLKTALNFDELGLIGHSMGAMNIAYYLRNTPDRKIKAAVLMDPGNILNFYPNNKNYPIDIPNFPTMLIWSSNFKVTQHGSMKLRHSDYEITLSPNVDIESNFTNHENFSDMSTLQYHPAYMITKLHNAFVEPKNSTLGIANGYEIANIINTYIIGFMDNNIKSQNVQSITECHQIKNTTIDCENK